MNRESDSAESSAGVTQYRGECHFSDCPTKFLGAGRSEYIDHLREEHGDLVARIYEDMVVGTCEGCGVCYVAESGDCPGCHETDGVIRGEFTNV